MDDGKEMTFTREDQHDKIYDQLVYELFVEPEPKWVDKSQRGLSKKARFLKNPNYTKPKNEIPL
jgi:hypothetical protein